LAEVSLDTVLSSRYRRRCLDTVFGALSEQWVAVFQKPLGLQYCFRAEESFFEESMFVLRLPSFSRSGATLLGVRLDGSLI
jgi:hypothetical protein